MSPTNGKTPVQLKVPEWLGPGALIGVVSVLAYLFAFTFEAGYAAAFHIPLNLIRVDIHNVFLAAGALLTLAIIMFGIADAVTSFIPKNGHLIIQLLKPHIPLALFYIAIFMLTTGTQMSLSAIRIICITGIGIFLMSFVFPVLSMRSEKRLKDRLAAQDKHDSQFSGISYELFRRYGWEMRLVFWSGYFLILVGVGGMSTAYKQRDFLVHGEDAGCAVLRVYDNLAVCAEFNKDSGEVLPFFTFLDLPGEASFEMKRIGPLEPVPIVTPTPTVTPAPTPTPSVTPTQE